MGRFHSGRERLLILCLAPLVFASFFGTLGWAARRFPVHYDWTHRVITNLLSPRDNPAHYQVACAGVVLTGLLMLPFAAYTDRRLRAASPRITRAGSLSFAAGCVLLTLSGLIVPRHYHSAFPRFHEFLARASAIGFALGASCFCLALVRDPHWPSPGRPMLRSVLLLCWCTVTLIPILSLAMAGAILLCNHFHLAFSLPLYRILHASAAWQLAFWEWLGAAAVFLFLLFSALLLPGKIPERDPAPTG